MFTIGDFARHGRVPVRMLRHYDTVGLHRPARVDPLTGYRFYEAGQLARRNRITALKELGFTLEQLRVMLDEQVSAAHLRGMLRLRRAGLASRIAGDTARLGQVEARLPITETEGVMPPDEVALKPVPAVRVAELTAIAAGLEPACISPVLRPLYAELGQRLARAGVEPAGLAIAWYEDAADGEGVAVHAALPVNARPGSGPGFAVTDLPALGQAATIVHRGPMGNVMASYQTLARWIGANGYRSGGYSRELYLECPDDEEKWVTELQEPVTPA